MVEPWSCAWMIGLAMYAGYIVSWIEAAGLRKHDVEHISLLRYGPPWPRSAMTPTETRPRRRPRRAAVHAADWGAWGCCRWGGCRSRRRWDTSRRAGLYRGETVIDGFDKRKGDGSVSLPLLRSVSLPCCRSVLLARLRMVSLPLLVIDCGRGHSVR